MQKKRVFINLGLIVIFIFLILVLPLVKSAIFESQPDAAEGKDTYIRENTNTNYGNIDTLWVGKIINPLYEYRSLIEFNISNVSSGNTIISAKLQLYVNSSSGFGNRTIKIYAITSEWNETASGWNNRTLDTPWSSAGGDYSDEIAYAVFSNTSGFYYNFTITSLVRSWLNGTYSNYGLMILSNDSQPGNYTNFASSDADTSSQRPKIIIDYTANAVPTINNLSQNSLLSSPTFISQNINFTANWTDIEGNSAKLFVCNSSNINYTGCSDRTFCNTSLEGSSLSASSFVSSCLYNILSIDNRTSVFYLAVCDSGSQNCSEINQSYFYINHASNITVIQPNGGETFNQSLGNSTIKFNVSDTDSDYLRGSLYYGETQSSTTNIITLNLNLTKYCTDVDSSTSTQNNCSYSWNTTGIYGSFFLTVIVNDSYITANDSSNSAFNIRSIIDNTPPNITSQWIGDSDISSGEIIQFYANVSDPNIKTVWVSLNTTPSINLTMTNSTSETYNISWTAVAVGTYQFKVYANDTIGNLNDSMSWQSFTIRKPNATAQNQYAPSTALPFSLIRITSQLNATDVLKNIYAYLNVPDDFIFISNYSQNYSMGNFTYNQTKTATWIVSVPLTESAYTLNVTYSDFYGNSWNSSNFNIQVNSSSAGGGSGGGTGNATVYFVIASGYPEVQTGYNYYTEAYFTLNGNYSTPDSIKISLYNPLGSLIQGPVDMALKETGIYNHTYPVPAGQTTGQWKTLVNATKNSANYYAIEFWKLVGALFDVGSIAIVNSSISNLNISVTVTNVEGTNAELILSWNLTRTDTNTQLNSGGETFAVNATPITKYYSPTTSYIGEVKITFLGRYSETETAGAYKIFNTTLTGAPYCGDGTCNNGETCSSCSSDCGTCPVTPPSGGGGGGGGGGVIIKEKIPNLKITKFEKIIQLTKNIEKKVYLEINNTGEKELNNITLELENLNEEFYTISPKSFSSLKPGKTQEFEITFLIKNFIGEQEFSYSINTNEITKKESGKIIVLSIIDFFLKEIERLNNRVLSIKNKTNEETLLTELKKCEEIISVIKSNVEKEEFINARDNIKSADDCLTNVENKIKKEVKIITIPGFKVEYTAWIITWVMMFILIVILIFIIYILYKKFAVMSFLKEMKKPKIRSKKSLKKQDIEKRIKDLEDKLEA